jgi:hypothetical protein
MKSVPGPKFGWISWAQSQQAELPPSNYELDLGSSILIGLASAMLHFT